MKIKTSQLIGPALDWVVAKCEALCLGSDPFGLKPIIAAPVFVKNYKPSTDWEQGGPIIEREKIDLEFMDNFEAWCGSVLREYGQDRESYSDDQDRESYTAEQESFVGYGPTPLIAAMRCYCCAKLGDEIDIPQELQPCQQPNL